MKTISSQNKQIYELHSVEEKINEDGKPHTTKPTWAKCSFNKQRNLTLGMSLACLLTAKQVTWLIYNHTCQ